FLSIESDRRPNIELVTWRVNKELIYYALVTRLEIGCAATESEIRGQHAGNRITCVVELDLPPDGVPVRSEAFLPNAVAQNGNVVGAGPVLLRKKVAS